jgi:hypothetical protein
MTVETTVKDTVNMGVVSDHQPSTAEQQPAVDNGPADQSQPATVAPQADASSQRRTPVRRPGSKAEAKKAARRLQADRTAAAVEAAAKLRAGQAPTGQQLAMADPEVLASEIRAVLGLDQAFTVSEIEGGGKVERTPLPPTLARQVGRPSEYTDEEGDLICQWIAEGNSLNQYSQKTGRRLFTLHRWMRANEKFRANYTRAIEERADTLVDAMLAIADNLPATVSMEQVKRAELQINTRKWCAERMRPSKWGLQQQVGPTQPITFNIGISREPAAPVEQVTIVQPMRLPDSTGSQSD